MVQRHGSGHEESEVLEWNELTGRCTEELIDNVILNEATFHELQECLKILKLG